MAKITRKQAVELLEKSKNLIDKMDDVKPAFEVLLLAGSQVGYAPAMRCLVAGNSPEDSIRWGK